MIEATCFGVRLRISPLFGVTITALLYLDSGHLPLLCLIASALHEAGHILLLILFRQPPSSITVGLWGVRIERRRALSLGYGRCAAVSLAGPAVNLLTALILWLAGAKGELTAVHATLGCLHLLPIETLDGGQALRQLVARVADEETADRILLRLSILLLFPMTLTGFAVLLYTGYNFSLLALCFYLIGGIFFTQKH